MKAVDVQKIQQFGAEVDGILTMSDLRVLFSSVSDAALFKKLKVFVREGQLVKVKKGFYALPAASLAAISQRIEPASYISTGTVLAREAIIGSIPARRIQAVKVGRPRTYRCDLGVVEHLSIKSGLFFGYEVRDGIRYATPEKAFLDVCYFLFKGRTFSFDPVEDVSMDELDARLIRDYLAAYDQRFRTFFSSTWSCP